MPLKRPPLIRALRKLREAKTIVRAQRGRLVLTRPVDPVKLAVLDLAAMSIEHAQSLLLSYPPTP